MTGPDSISAATSVTAGPTSPGSDLVGFGTVSHKADGFLGGGQVGFNYQTGMFVFGVEGDVSWADIKGGSNIGPVIGAPLGANFNTDVDWTATLTGRLGLAFDRWLVYGKGGVAWAHDKYNTNFYTFPGTVELSETRVGWTVGAGVEYAFAPQWTAKLEYNYMDFGNAHRFVRAGHLDRHRPADPCGQVRHQLQIRRRADHGALLSSASTDLQNPGA